MSQQLEWERSSYDATVLHCSCTDMPLNAWYKRMVSLLQKMEGTPEFRVQDNGYRRHPSVLVHGVYASYRGYNFSIWSDVAGEIILMHEAVPRRAVEPLCSAVKHCWAS